MRVIEAIESGHGDEPVSIHSSSSSQKGDEVVAEGGVT